MFNKPIRDDLSFKLVLEVVYDLKDLILAESKWDYQCLAERNYFLFCFDFFAYLLNTFILIAVLPATPRCGS